VNRLKSRILIGVTASTFVQAGVGMPPKRIVQALHQGFVDLETLAIRYEREDGVVIRAGDRAALPAAEIPGLVCHRLRSPAGRTAHLPLRPDHCRGPHGNPFPAFAEGGVQPVARRGRHFGLRAGGPPWCDDIVAALRVLSPRRGLS
jgi:hypothetical protein